VIVNGQRLFALLASCPYLLMLPAGGKTHTALTALMAAPSGVYCGPLRLLACEVSSSSSSTAVAAAGLTFVEAAEHTCLPCSLESSC
jgi:hypothetical protein